MQVAAGDDQVIILVVGMVWHMAHGILYMAVSI